MHVAEHRVIGMTGKARSLFWDAVVLKMGGGNIGGVIDERLFPWASMTWQDKQNCVDFEFSKSIEAPKTVATIGRIKNAMKATILPPCAAVMEGRISNRPIRMILKTMTVATA